LLHLAESYTGKSNVAHHPQHHKKWLRFETGVISKKVTRSCLSHDEDLTVKNKALKIKKAEPES
jgi:hypothetical protein